MLPPLPACSRKLPAAPVSASHARAPAHLSVQLPAVQVALHKRLVVLNGLVQVTQALRRLAAGDVGRRTLGVEQRGLGVQIWACMRLQVAHACMGSGVRRARSGPAAACCLQLLYQWPRCRAVWPCCTLLVQMRYLHPLGMSLRRLGRMLRVEGGRINNIAKRCGPMCDPLAPANAARAANSAKCTEAPICFSAKMG